MPDLHIPDLSFPSVRYGKTETPWNLRPLLYRCGAGTNKRIVGTAIARGTLGDPVAERLPLVTKIYDVLAGKIAGGGSRHSLKIHIMNLRYFFSWADEGGRSLTLASIESAYIHWTDHLLHRQRVLGNIQQRSIYHMACTVSEIFSDVLDRRVVLLKKNRIRKPSKKNFTKGNTDRQNLNQTFAFGHAMLDITDALSIEAIFGSLPVKIHLRTGQVIEEWSGLSAPEKVKSLNQEPKNADERWVRKECLNSRERWEKDTSLRTRYPLVNLRLQAELHIFIAQTGMNLAQAHQIKVGKFSYRSHLNGYQVQRVYKNRRRGEVDFEIFSEYRELFERYLAWREVIFPNDENGLLFPFYSNGHGRASDVPPSFSFLAKRCKKLSIQYISPQKLRKTRINWLLRRSRDPALTAEMNAHTQKTLLREYEQPDLQVAMVEINRFHRHTDPSIVPPGPGVCVKVEPTSVPDAPPGAPIPDCKTPAGCLFCMHLRDIDSEDHIWSLASYKHLRSQELISYRVPVKSSKTSGIIATIDRVTEKLMRFEKSSGIRALWVSEALTRIEEGYYHPRWGGFIQILECGV